MPPGSKQGDPDTIIPPAIAALFTEPSSEPPAENFPQFRGVSSIEGVTSSDGSGQDLFFPKPFNAEQAQIVQRLAVRDGVVVQGPPGTGKTHTIANIVSRFAGRDWGFSYHVDAGLGLRVASRTTVEFGARYTRTTGLEYDGSNGLTAQNFRPRLSSVSAMMGVRQVF